MFAQILAVLKGIIEIFGLLKTVVGYVQTARKNGWINDGRELTKKIKEAKTDEDRKKLIADWARHLS